MAPIDRRGGARMRRGGGRGLGGSGGPGPFDATKIYALSGITAADFYQTQPGGGEAGSASGFGGVAVVVARALQAANQLYAGRLSSGAGWQTGVVNGNDQSLYTFPFLQASCKLAGAKVGRVLLDFFQTTQGQSRVMQDLLDTIGTATLASYVEASGASVEQIGMAGSASPSTATDHVAHLRWRGTPSTEQLIALANLIRALGDVPSKAAVDAIFQPSATDADIAALAPIHWFRGDTHTLSAGNLATLTNRGSAGGQLAVTFGALAAPAADAALAGALSVAFAGGQNMDSSLPASAWSFLHDGTGHDVFTVWVPTSLASARVLWATRALAAGSETGAHLYTTAGALANMQVVNGANISVDVSTPALALDVGTYVETSYLENVGPEAFIGLRNAAPSGFTSTLTPSASAPQGTFRVGGGTGGAARLIGRVADIIAFNRRLTPIEREIVRAYIRVRYGIGGAAVSHRWSLREMLEAAGVSVFNGDLAPAIIPDTATGAAIDAMERVGSPVVRVIDPSVDGRKTYGALGFSATAHLKTSVAILNNPTVSIELTVIFSSALASSKHILSNANGSGVVGGLSLYQSAGTLNLYSYGAGALVASVAIPAAGLGWPRKVRIEYTGAVWRLFLDDVQQGADNAGIHTPSNLPLFLGTFGDGTSPSDNISAMALRVGTYASPSQHYYDLTQDVVANGGPQNGIPAVVRDRVGTDDLSLVGTGLTVAQRAERWWSYETTPVFRGVRNLSLANYLSVITALTGSAVPYWIAIPVVVHAKAGGTYQILSCKASSNGFQGVNFYGALTYAQLQYTHGTGAAAVSNTYTLPDAELGRVVIMGYQWTGTVLQSFAKRARNGADAAATAFAPWAGAMHIGRHGDTVSNPGSDNASVLGIMGGIGSNITLAEWQSMYDACVADEDLVAIPGKTSRLFSVKRSGGLAAVDAMGSGETLAVTGSPIVSDLYSRAFAL